MRYSIQGAIKKPSFFGVDSIVDSACKLLETNPEYGRGVQAFPEYIPKGITREGRSSGRHRR